MLADPHVVAVGETGLDFYRDEATPEQQRIAFAAHIDLARKHGKPLTIHTRESMDAALDQLAEDGAEPPFIFHCWSGTTAQMKIALDLGAYISFAGNVSFKNAESLREAARLVPEDRLLVETDSPFLAPMPHRGHPNEPRFVPFVGLAIAQAREVSVHMLAERTSQNARAVFGIDR
jgi:TatD DNase family protein